jgi:hypothetical protein
MSEYRTNYSASEILRLIATAKFRPFDQMDWERFSGCQTENPMIAEYEYNGRTGVIVLDGEGVEIVAPGRIGGQMFSLSLLD